MADQLRFGVLGPLTVWAGGRPHTPGGAGQANLLGALLLADGRPVSGSRLAEWLWDGHPPEQERKTLQVAVSRLRGWLRGIGADVAVELAEGGYVLRLPPRGSDIGEFRALVEVDPPGESYLDQLDRLERALRLWRGPLLAGLTAPTHAAPAALAVERARVEAATTLAEIAIRCGEPKRAVPLLETLADERVYDEHVHACLALAYCAGDDQVSALRTIERVRTRLVEDLGVSPGRTLRDAHAQILASQQGPMRERQRWWGPRPRSGQLIGRAEEQRALAAELTEHRLVTVTGPGGCGKTSLAMNVAEHADRPGGTAIAELAPLQDGNAIILALGSLTGVTGDGVHGVFAGLVSWVADRELLLVLDNCEHLAEPCAALVERLLAWCPRLTVLTTARQPLGLPAERVFALGPLPAPASGRFDADNPAIVLFRARAGTALPSGPDAEADVATICHHLDGLPLALELAAARVPSLGLRQLRERLEGGLDLLTRAAGEPRHRTMERAVGWSFRLLTEQKQLLLARLSVFRGEFGLSDVESVCGGAPLDGLDFAARLADLVERSLVQALPRQRYRLLTVVREFAEARLAEYGETVLVRDRHAQRWTSRARELDALPSYGDRLAGVRAMGREVADLDSALAHVQRRGRNAQSNELVAKLFEFWHVHGSYIANGQAQLDRALRTIWDSDPEVRSLLRFQEAQLARLREDYVSAVSIMASARRELAAHRPREHRIALIFEMSCLRFLLDPAAVHGTPRMLEQIASLETGSGDDVATSLTAGGGVYATWGRYEEAAELCRRYEVHRVERGLRISTAQLALRTEVALGRKDIQAAESWCERLAERLGPTGGPLEQEPARRAIGTTLLAKDPASAVDFLDDSVRQLRRLFPRSLSRVVRLQSLSAEALRRTGQPLRAREVLSDALASAIGRSHFRFGMAAALQAAVVAAELDDPAAKILAAAWDGVRTRLGLPAPIGVAHVVRDVLGIDPAPSTPQFLPWPEQELREVVHQAYLWTVGLGP
ncbi:ATP-binding protein [Allokutzneria albata]|uniref:ATP-binding protein n=1 Tax=Allokutzneria albata TaxID=211114 RepID=UPI000AAACC08|nr:BTAD domain-containing putative transcriptional regulator [Allokutzneria albata]